ncbi:MAG: 4Fe-4S binding protein [bacterium]|nr:4Fe-4S binding protein [bacterium]
MARKRSKFNIYRVPLQIVVLLLLGYMVVRQFVDSTYLADFEAYCPFGGLQALGSFLISNTLACSMTTLQIAMGLALVLGVLLLGKLFCSFICPIGSFSEWLGGIGARFGIRYSIKGLADRLLRLPKYALLFITFYFTFKSSELFCKEYDPFYALFSGFEGDVVLQYAIPALIITVLGAIFVRLFWCKYLCPLGAVTNLFANALITVPLLAGYVILRRQGNDISWVWPLALICAVGFLLEAFRLKGLRLPPLKITRNPDSCTSCNLCNRSCPMGLEIAKVDKVRHIDCHLCGDCLGACPVEGTLMINRKPLRWLPATAVVILIAAGIYLGGKFEVPTINVRWADDQELAGAEMYSLSGLKSIKCFGSASGFANQMRQVDGVYGVEAYVKSHTVKVFYDPAVLSPQKVKAAIFTPAKSYLEGPAGEVAVLDLKIDKFFDGYDNYYLRLLLEQSEGVYGYSTEFGEPVLAKIYFDAAILTPEQIKTLVESPKVSWEFRGVMQSEKLNFEVPWMGDVVEKIEAMAFLQALFNPFEAEVNDLPEGEVDLQVYQVPLEQAMLSSMQRQMRFLCAHLAKQEAIIGFRTVLTDQPYARISFLGSRISAEEVWQALNEPTLTFNWSSGEAAELPNPFKFKVTGTVVQADLE